MKTKKKVKKDYFEFESILSCKIPSSHAEVKNITAPKGGRGAIFWPIIVVT